MSPDSFRTLRTSPVKLSTRTYETLRTHSVPACQFLHTLIHVSGLVPDSPDSPLNANCSGMAVFTRTYGFVPDSSGFSGLAPAAGIVTLRQFLHALIDFYGLVPFGVLKF